MRPRCSILTGGFDFSGCGDCTSCPPFEQAEMSNSEPSAIVLQGIPCMYDATSFDSSGETVRSRFAAIQIACSSARGADDSCKTPICLCTTSRTTEKQNVAVSVLQFESTQAIIG